MVKHVVFLKFNQNVPDSAIAEMEDGLAKLPGIIPEIVEFQSGRDLVHSERSYDFALVSAFEDLEAMRRYQVHPEHKKVLNKIKELCNSILAVDFEYML